MPRESGEARHVRAELLIGGRVQGVFFRSTTHDVAQSLNLSGYVRNRADGRVEAVFEGPERQVRQAVAWCREGPRSARVEEVDVQWRDPTGEFIGFGVRH